MSRPFRLKAPGENGAILAVPPLAEIEQLVQHNRQTLEQNNVRILDRSLDELRRQARQHAVVAARGYLQHAGQMVSDHGPEVLILAGHQPELFHPGVWAKNFAIAGLSRRLQATSFNLVVDSDVAKSTLLRLPARRIPEGMGLLDSDRNLPWLVRIPFDVWGSDIPFEEKHVLDESLFASLPERTSPWFRDWNFAPLLPDIWAEVRKQSSTSALLGERLARARRAFEQQWGCRNLEAPTSLLCQTESFAWFASHIFAKLPDFHRSFNDAVRAYRRLHRIRSRHHPMPDLIRDGDWLEAPFWAWQAGAGRRGRLFVRPAGDALAFRAGNDTWPSLRLANLVNEYQELERSGYRIRTRALTTTLFARLFLADVFMHGLGGGLYDAVTDQVIRDFFGIEPPRFAILTGTLRLPFPEACGPSPDCRRLEHEIRDMTYNPQRYLTDTASALTMIEDKQAWLRRSASSREERQRRFQTIRELNRQIAAQLEGTIQKRRRQLVNCGREIRSRQILDRRDFSFCLHSEASLRAFLTGIMHA